MRARLPDREGVIERDGVRVAFEIFGNGEPALLLVPASPITHARSWKGLVPSLARRFTVVTTDGPPTPECYAPPNPQTGEAERRWADRLDAPTGWGMRNRHFWRQDGGYREWVEFFFGQQLPEPHSTKQYDDTVGWALDTDAEAMIAEREGRAAPPAREAGALCRRVRCPVRVLHGSADRCQPVARGRRLAELTGGDVVVLAGAGHLRRAGTR
jgi:pimeloyl-ACP methyl ester carboxylesterase